MLLTSSVGIHLPKIASLQNQLSIYLFILPVIPCLIIKEKLFRSPFQGLIKQQRKLETPDDRTGCTISLPTYSSPSQKKKLLDSTQPSQEYNTQQR